MTRSSRRTQRGPAPHRPPCRHARVSRAARAPPRHCRCPEGRGWGWTGGFDPSGVEQKAEPQRCSTGPSTGAASSGGLALRRSSSAEASPCSSASTSFSRALASSVFHLSAERRAAADVDPYTCAKRLRPPRSDQDARARWPPSGEGQGKRSYEPTRQNTAPDARVQPLGKGLRGKVGCRVHDERNEASRRLARHAGNRWVASHVENVGWQAGQRVGCHSLRRIGSHRDHDRC